MAEENHRILLDQIDYPSDLRKLEVKDLPRRCVVSFAETL